MRRIGRQNTDRMVPPRLPRVLHYAVLYLLIQMSVYGVTFFLPPESAIARAAAVRGRCVTAIPWLCAGCRLGRPAMAARSGRPRTVALASYAPRSGLPHQWATDARHGRAVPCWPHSWRPAGSGRSPTDELAGAAAAAGIALINSRGAISGFVAPNVRTWADQTFASPAAGPLVLAMATLLGALLVSLIPRIRTPDPQRMPDAIPDAQSR